ncbi:outer membrane protein transport protein [Devosia rhodophyticola]|uniref:Outer membrane protein transport protein n=1 Tax=Devosia rhodophyticola TaxID=3026423 RepID=A0ABY7YWI0_9HYPH|nr:outer membrane protein transport protein [Devosia rhodophyticola]WDR05443.1 outer membrane protein transport protein [Devosia rhodophyticola]
MNAHRNIMAAMIGLATSLPLVGGAFAGGLEANGYDWDALFDPATYASKATATYVYINKDVTNAGVQPGIVATTPSIVYYNAGFKADFLDMASCLVSVQNPFGANTARTNAYAALTGQAVNESIRSTDTGLTCAVGMQTGPGVFSVIGGLSAQNLSYDADVPTSLTTSTPVSINGWSAGWRAGVAYEIPEIALRVSAIYNSAVKYDLSGTAYGGAATANVETPQSIELKAQTGIAPGWLALGSVEWMNWEALQKLTVNTIGAPLVSNLGYRDGWTVTAGVGHSINEQLSILGLVTWDRGTSTPGAGGVLMAGSQTDRYGITLGVSYDISETVQFTGGVSASTLAGGTNASGEQWGTSGVFAINGGLKASF